MKSLSASYDKSKYYRFYQDHGHDTKEYIQLRYEIKDLIRHSYFGKYIYGGAQPEA